MAKSTAIKLSEEELTEWKTITRCSKAEKRMVERAKIILACMWEKLTQTQ